MSRAVTSADVAILVQSSPWGFKTSEIAEHFHVRHETALQLARYAKAAGLISSVNVKGWRGWMSRDLADARAAELMEARKAHKRAMHHKRRAEMAANPGDSHVDPPDWPITRRIVRAGDEPPPKTTAPRSVFELGRIA